MSIESRGNGGGFVPLIAGLFLFAMSAMWLGAFSAGLWTFPRHASRSSVPERDATATYLPSGKSRLGLTASGGEVHRYPCDPFTRLCRFAMDHSPVDLEVRTVGPGAVFSDTAILSARKGDVVLMTDAEGQANLASLEQTYRGGLTASIAGLLLGGWLLHSRWRLKKNSALR